MKILILYTHVTNKKKVHPGIKEEALKLAEKTGSQVKVATDLGLHPNMLYLWKKELARHPDKAFPGNGNPVEKELHDLRRKNAKLEEELEILKKCDMILQRLTPS